ncbi:phage portal protein [Bradyrhizobium barranii]|uniref:Phage portal protein n=1 Tax=Bradyrhizobium barranii TaxID=2992140 RepID=A0ABY3R128_9BRAD|nr:phage portal protein [Bradyrhizobium japonicum]UFW91047.1 phage portal protein [Bradyrhizobium japonicum]
MLRTIIETRKDQIERMEWLIRPKKIASKKPSATAEADPRVAALKEFFEKPDGVHTWTEWLRLLLEDMFVIDAATLYMEKSRGGQLLALHPLDGGTIKRVIDDWGRTPTAMQPEIGTDNKPTGRMLQPVAYQQVLKGLPAIDYTTSELLYKPRNIRTNRAYGFSPVEQIIMTVNIALRRQMFLLNYYTEGNIPEALVGVPETWTPAQIQEYQTYFDQLMAGDLAARRRLKFIPGGIAKGGVVATKEPELKSDFDEWLVRICCFAFSVSPTPFIKQMNRATAGTQKEQSDQEGLAPVLSWIRSVINGIIVAELKISDLEFAWGDDTQIEPKDEADILTKYTAGAVMTLNQAREKLGLEPYSNPLANEPMVLTAQGYVPLTAYDDTQKRADESAKNMADALTGGAAGDQDDPNNPGGGGKSGAVVPDAASPAAGKPDAKAEKVRASEHWPFNKSAKRLRRLAPIPFDRKATRVATASIQHRLQIAFGKWKPALIKQVAKALAEQGVQKIDDADEEEIAANIAAALEFDGLSSLANDLGIDLGDIATNSVSHVIAQMGVTDAGDLVNQVNDRAVAFARDRAAEMVGMRYDEDGTLVENPNAEWAITDTMRDDLKRVIADGLEQNIGIDEITANIEALGGFSADRAEMIAEAEVRRANSQAALDGYGAARDSLDIRMGKQWLLGPNPCEVCQANADQGVIDIDEPFQSGDDAPPGHPWCECALAPVVAEDDVPDGAEAEPVADESESE